VPGHPFGRRWGSRDNAAMTSQQRFAHITQPEGVAPGHGYSHVVVALAHPEFLLKVEALALAGGDGPGRGAC
jgi:hypothetical protein